MEWIFLCIYAEFFNTSHSGAAARFTFSPESDKILWWIREGNAMYKLLIVEDEDMLREALLHSVDWAGVCSVTTLPRM